MEGRGGGEGWRRRWRGGEEVEGIGWRRGGEKRRVEEEGRGGGERRRRGEDDGGGRAVSVL